MRVSQSVTVVFHLWGSVFHSRVWEAPVKGTRSTRADFLASSWEGS